MKPVYIDIHIHTSEDPNRINTDYNCDVLMEQVRKISGEAEVLLSLTDHNTINKSAYLDLKNKVDYLILGVELHIRKYAGRPPYHYYVRDDQEYVLRTEEVDSSTIVHKVIDDEGIWSPDDYQLCIRRKYSIRTYQCLFGPNGIACNNAKLGIALMWTSPDSKQRGVIPIGEIENSQRDLEFELNYEFSEAQLRGSVEFSTIIYLKEAGTPLWGEEHLANQYGCILGELDNKFVIRLDGNGSVFPMYEIHEPGQPLWYVKCDWIDPTYDLFSDSVSIYINTAHKNYKYLDKTKRTFDEQLLKEIMASALGVIITKLKEQEDYWDVTTSGEDLQSGSVSEAIHYFIDTLEWDVSGPEAMSLSIRKFFDQRI